MKGGSIDIECIENTGVLMSLNWRRVDAKQLSPRINFLQTNQQSLLLRLKNAEKELDGIGKKGGIQSVSETEWKNISVFLEDICKRVQENARKDLLEKIEKRANEFYKKFTEHDKGYTGEVKIGSDYSIEFDAGLNTSHEDRK